MKCYYEILEVSREADDNEIKTAYRKLALRWHPDKNIENTEQAKEQFQLVQQAYEVLSDRQERAWYDNHREQILRGSDANYKDDSLDVFPYFTTQCFKGYGDDEHGFYTVYRTVFENLTKEDIEHIDSKSDYDEIPQFGCSTSDYDRIVGPFYAYWMSYTTRKSYVWLDPYNIKDTPNRRYSKLVEKENKKVRQKAKKERNDEIRNLVAFVRKRDRRVQAYAKFLEQRNAENRLKQEQLRKQKILARKEELNNDSPQADWTKFDNVHSELKEIEKSLAAEFGESDSDEEEEENNDLYCVACNKLFKNPKAFENHELSKKHRENVEKLKILMQEEELEDDEEEELTDLEDDSDLETSSEKNDVEDTISDNLEEITESELNYLKTKETDSGMKNNIELNINDSSLEEDHQQPDTNFSKKKSKNKQQLPAEIDSNLEANGESNSPEVEDLEDLSESDSELTKSKKKKQKNKKILQPTTDLDPIRPHSISEPEEWNNKSKKKTKKNKTKPEPRQEIVEPSLDQVEDDSTTTSGSKKQKKKNKTKPNSTGNKIEAKLINLEDVDVAHVCVCCSSKFNSKNKLFEHLKKTGHSVALPGNVAKSKKKQMK